MRERPKSILIIGLLFVAVGMATMARGVWGPVADLHAGKSGAELRRGFADAGWVVGSAAVALAGGVGVLRGKSWARWFLVAWMVFHLVIGAMHEVEKLIVHAVLFAPIFYFLFRRRAGEWFGACRDRTMSSE